VIVGGRGLRLLSDGAADRALAAPD